MSFGGPPGCQGSFPPWMHHLARRLLWGENIENAEFRFRLVFLYINHHAPPTGNVWGMLIYITKYLRLSDFGVLYVFAQSVEGAVKPHETNLNKHTQTKTMPFRGLHCVLKVPMVLCRLYLIKGWSNVVDKLIFCPSWVGRN